MSEVEIMFLKRKKTKDSTRLPTQLLWGVTFIILLLLCAQTIYFYFNMQSHYQQYRMLLHQKLITSQQNRLTSELNDVQYMINQMFAEATELLKQETRLQTQQALTLMNSLYQRYHQQLSEAEMKVMLIESLRDIRFFDGRGYYFIDEMDGTILLLPIDPQKEGSLVVDSDDRQQAVMHELIQAASDPQREGFSHYRWYAPGNDKVMRNKISHVRIFEPYNWLIGTGDYLYRFENDLKPKIYNYIRNIHFGRTGYVALIDDRGQLLSSGVNSERTDVNYLQDPNSLIRQAGRDIFAMAGAGGGFLSYDWSQKEQSDLSQQFAKVEPITDRGWILLAGISQDEVDELFLSEQEVMNVKIKQYELHQVLALSVIGLLALLITLTYNRWLKARFRRYEDNIQRQQDELRETADSLKLSALIVESAHEGVIICDAKKRILQVNSAFTRITGYREDEVLCKTPDILSSGVHNDSFYQEISQRLSNEGSWRGEIWRKRKDGEVYPEWLSISENKNSKGEVQHYIATFSDITHIKELEHKLRYLAETDPLTGLANRRTLMDCLNHDIAAQDRYQAPKVALFYLDLDRFKLINDCYGHDIGDSLLIEVANRLKSCLRESDLPCRVGGDEFILIIKFNEADESKQLIPFTQRLLNKLTKPLNLTSIDIDISCSIGVAIYQPGDDAYGLMKRADQALYKAKREGRGRACFYDETVSEGIYPTLIDAVMPASEQHKDQ